MKPDWHLVATSAEGRSGGLVAFWDPGWASLKAYSFFGGILLTGYFQGFSQRIHLINVYAPFLERLGFWKKMEDSGLLHLKNLILRGISTLLCMKMTYGGRRAERTLWQHRSTGFLQMLGFMICPLWKTARLG